MQNQVNYSTFLLEMKRVRKIYSQKEMPHTESMEVLKNLFDLFGLSVLFDKEIDLRNSV